MTKQRRRGIFWGLIAFAILSVVALIWEGPRIEDDLTEKAQSRLADRGLSSLDVDFDGRDATITGTIPASANFDGNLDGLEDYIRSEPGVRTVDTEGVSLAPAPTATPAPTPTAVPPTATAVPPTATAVPATAVPAPTAVPTGITDVDASVNGDQIVLSGQVLSEANRQAIVESANFSFGAANVTDNLTVADLAPEIDGVDGRVGSLAGLIGQLNGNLLDGRASLVGSDLSLSGRTPSAAALDTLTGSVSGLSNVNGTADLTVDAATVVRNIDLDGVEFESGTANLTGESQAILDEAAATLQEFTDINVEVAGHTDSQGDDASNQTLSQARAESVVAYLVDAGVSASQLTPTGYGESQPIADNDTADGRQTNRRVELVVQEG